MKKISRILLITLSCVALFFSCSKEDNASEPKLVVYKNQTGDLNADALQAQCTGGNNEYTINIYGNFDSSNNPKDIKTLTYQKANNDTIYHYMIESLTNRIESCFYAVNGVKSNVVLKFEYPTNQTDNINVGFYEYNWQTQTSQKLYGTEIQNTSSVVTSNPYYAARNNTAWGLAQIAGAFIATDIIYVGLGGTTTAILSTATAATLSAALAPLLGTVAVATSIGYIIYTFTDDAGASELSPTDTPYPFNTPINNPIPAPDNPTPNLQNDTCFNNNINFGASMDASGTISILSVSGGASPYTYFVDDTSQATPFFMGNYADGNYSITVKDANNCLRSQQINLSRPSNSVTIGTQIWSSTNLDVTTYRDGTPIPQVTDQAQWANLTTGAWCYYNNDPANGATYGKLYNWYAVAGIYDAASAANPSLRKKLAPTGWHIPSDAEWTTLTDFLGGILVAGGKMKSTGTALWVSPNTDATNSSGFTALPGGYRIYNDIFIDKGASGDWWSSTEGSSTNAFERSLYFNLASVYRLNRIKSAGGSVRCVKD
jgi:uncharacterized protein (TIGR02145 family)